MKSYILIDEDCVAFLSNDIPNHLNASEIARGYEAFKNASNGLTLEWHKQSQMYVKGRIVEPFPERPEPYSLKTDKAWAKAVDQRRKLEDDLRSEYQEIHPVPEFKTKQELFKAYVGVLCHSFGFTLCPNSHELVRL